MREIAACSAVRFPDLMLEAIALNAMRRVLMSLFGIALSRLSTMQFRTIQLAMPVSPTTNAPTAAHDNSERKIVAWVAAKPMLGVDCPVQSTKDRNQHCDWKESAEAATKKPDATTRLLGRVLQ